MIRTSLSALAFSCACLGLLVGAEPPNEKVSKHIGAMAVEYLSRIEKVEAFRVGKLDIAKAGTEETVGGREIVGKPIPVDKEVAARLVNALSAESTYFNQDSKGTSTGVGYRLWTNKKECVELSCCLAKGNIWMVVKDANGKVLASGDKRGFRNEPDSPMRLIAAELFPEDKDVQANKPKATLKPKETPTPAEPMKPAKPAKPAEQSSEVFTAKINGIDVEIFIPSGVKTIRGVIVHAANYALPVRATDRWAELGREIGFAHVAMQMNLKATNRPQKLGEALREGLKEFATTTGHPELTTVPLAGTGHSAGGMVIPALQLMPERILTVCVDCSWVSDPEKWPEKAVGAPALFTMGAIPDAFKMLPAIEQFYEPARKKGMPWGLGLQWGCAHDWANAGVMHVMWIRAVAKARIADDGSMKPIAFEKGWLGDRKSLNGQFATIASWDDYTGDKANASWFPDREVASIWRAWQTKDSPVTLEAATSDGKARLAPFDLKKSRDLNVPAKSDIELTVSLKEGTELKQVEYYSGDRVIGTVKSAPWKFTWKNPPAGTHGVYAQWESTSGTKGVCNPSLSLIQAGK